MCGGSSNFSFAPPEFTEEERRFFGEGSSTLSQMRDILTEGKYETQENQKILEYEGALKTGAQKDVLDWLNREPTEYERAQQEIGLLQSQRQLKALKGELPLSNALRKQKQDEFNAVKENAARKGNIIEGSTPETAIGRSTAANEALGKFNTRWGMREDLERRGEISSGEALNLSRYGLTSDMTSRDIGTTMGIGAGFTPGTSQREYMNSANQYSQMGLLPSYSQFLGSANTLTQPYTQQRAWQYLGGLRAQQQQSEELMADRAGIWGLAGNMTGMAGGLLAASSRDFKKNILEIEPEEEDRALKSLSSKKIYRWDYRGEKNSQGHMSLLAEEAPKEVVSSDGKYLDVGNYMGLLTSAVKSLSRKIDNLESIGV